MRLSDLRLRQATSQPGLIASRNGAALVLCSALAVWCGALHAADTAALRDPTVPPALSGPNAAVLPNGEPGGAGFSIIVKDGKLFLAVNTRLYSQGQTVGRWKIVRITETAVTVREGNEVRTLQQFSGVERVMVQPTASAVQCGASAPVQSTANARRTVQRNPKESAEVKRRGEPAPCPSVADATP